MFKISAKKNKISAGNYNNRMDFCWKIAGKLKALKDDILGLDDIHKSSLFSYTFSSHKTFFKKSSIQHTNT